MKRLLSKAGVAWAVAGIGLLVAAGAATRMVQFRTQLEREDEALRQSRTDLSQQLTVGEDLRSEVEGLQHANEELSANLEMVREMVAAGERRIAAGERRIAAGERRIGVCIEALAHAGRTYSLVLDGFDAEVRRGDLLAQALISLTAEQAHLVGVQAGQARTAASEALSLVEQAAQVFEGRWARAEANCLARL
jgi:septal ring factor EnvC (AmiA/AmiB activator)